MTADRRAAGSLRYYARAPELRSVRSVPRGLSFFLSQYQLACLIPFHDMQLGEKQMKMLLKILRKSKKKSLQKNEKETLKEF